MPRRTVATVSDLPNLRWTEQVVTEAIRLYPPGVGIWLRGDSGLQIGGYAVPRRQTIIISPWVLHRDPRHFERSTEFRPEWWSGDLARRMPRSPTSRLVADLASASAIDLP